MLNIEYRKLFHSKGLIDDFVVFGGSDDYIEFSKIVESVIFSKEKESIETSSNIWVEVILSNKKNELFTSLQNDKNEYFSTSQWDNRNILKVIGSEGVLIHLKDFLSELATKGKGYSYISEFSNEYSYSHDSPEWRLHLSEG